MAKLPTAASFGARPSAAVSGSPSPAPIPGGAGAAPGLARAAGAQARAASQPNPIDLLGQMTDAFAERQAKIDSRDDAVERARAVMQFTEGATNELLRLETEGDFSDRKTAQNYIKGLDDQITTLLNEHSGSADSRAALQARLLGIKTRFSVTAAEKRLAGQEKLVLSTLGESLKGLTNQAYEAPGSIGELYQSLDAQIDDMAAALTPEAELEHRTIGRAQIAASALESFLDRGMFEDARDLMSSTPGLVDALSPEKQRELQGRITAFQQAEAKAYAEGVAKLTELRTILGRDPLPDERARYAGVAPPKRERTISDKINEAEEALGRPLEPGERERLIGIDSEDTDKASSPQGKLLQDREMFVKQFGADSPQVKAFDDMVNSEGGAALSDIAGIRKEFTALSRSFVEKREAASAIAAAANQNTGAGDIALIYGFVRMQSPGVVGDREADLVASTGGAGQMAKLAWERWRAGDRLTPEMRMGLKEAAEAVFRSQIFAQVERERQYYDIAVKNGITPSEVVIDFVGPHRPEGMNLPGIGNDAPAPEPPKKRFRVDLDGNIIGGEQ